MITPLTEKLFVKDYQHPYYTVKDKTFYSKPLAVKYCKEVGWQFPSFNIWHESKKFSRPKKTFAEYVKINPSNYVTISSFTHAKMYDKFVLNIPDNFSNGAFYNVSLDEMVSVTEEAINKGYTIELDCDVSEKTFSSKNGVAVIPASSTENEKALKEIVEERTITSGLRQAEFENFNTTDDHLMHIVGLVKDQKGNTYFKVKNSWGKNQGNQGYVYMSVPYFKLKTISVLLHKDAVSPNLKSKLKI